MDQRSLPSSARTEAGRITLDTLKLRMPVLGHMFRCLYLVRFSSTMATLLSAGVSLIDVVRICREVTGNVHYTKLWILLEDRISKGQEIAPTFREFDFVPRNVVAMIASGEKSGRLSEVLEHAATAAEDDLLRAGADQPAGRGWALYQRYGRGHGGLPRHPVRGRGRGSSSA